MGWGQMGTEPGVGVPDPLLCPRRSCLAMGAEAANSVHWVLLLWTPVTVGFTGRPGWRPVGVKWSAISGVPKVPQPSCLSGTSGLTPALVPMCCAW